MLARPTRLGQLRRRAQAPGTAADVDDAGRARRKRAAPPAAAPAADPSPPASPAEAAAPAEDAPAVRPAAKRAMTRLAPPKRQGASAPARADPFEFDASDSSDDEDQGAGKKAAAAAAAGKKRRKAPGTISKSRSAAKKPLGVKKGGWNNFRKLKLGGKKSGRGSRPFGRGSFVRKVASDWRRRGAVDYFGRDQFLPEESSGPAASQHLVNVIREHDLAEAQAAAERAAVVAATTRYHGQTDSLDEILRDVFGHTSFRGEQRAAIEAIVAGQSALFVAATGTGKSLCYQVPALVLPGVALVVSPLISLMQDQVAQLPAELPGLVLSGTAMDDQGEILRRIVGGQVKIIFASPERVFSDWFVSLLGTVLQDKISFVCIDEAHCVSEWSHNFRTSYLHLHRVLRGHTFLALTATATQKTVGSITEHLGIKTVLVAEAVRSNLTMTVSCDEDRREALLQLLRGPRFAPLSRIIVYCFRQAHTEELANFLKSNRFSAEAYHAGKPKRDRSRVQAQFVSGAVRIVVATVAFGMGINVSDVGGVIHFHLPKSLESYVQETGRAGRNGAPAQCHAFLSQEDYFNMHSLTHSDSADEAAVARLVRDIFAPESSGAEGDAAEVCCQRSGTLVGIPTQRAAQEFDVKPEVQATVLSLLEASLGGRVEVLPPGPAVAEVSFYTTKSLESLANFYPLVHAIVTQVERDSKGGETLAAAREALGSGQRVKLPLALLAGELKMTVAEVRTMMRDLAQAGVLTYTLAEPSLWARVAHEAPSDLDKLAASIHKQLAAHEELAVFKLCKVYDTLRQAAFVSVQSCLSAEMLAAHEYSCEDLHGQINDYFSDGTTAAAPSGAPSMDSPRKIAVQGDLMVFLSRYHTEMTSARSIARIFHGLPSPLVDAEMWRGNPFWGRHRHVDFNRLLDLAETSLATFAQSKELKAPPVRPDF